MPVEPAGNHQMKHEPEISFQTNTDSFPQPPQLSNPLTFHAVDWWHGGAQQKRRPNLHTFERFAEDSLLKRFDVDNNVRKFGHGFKRLAMEAEGHKSGWNFLDCTGSEDARGFRIRPSLAALTRLARRLLAQPFYGWVKAEAKHPLAAFTRLTHRVTSPAVYGWVGAE